MNFRTVEFPICLTSSLLEFGVVEVQPPLKFRIADSQNRLLAVGVCLARESVISYLFACESAPRPSSAAQTVPRPSSMAQACISIVEIQSCRVSEPFVYCWSLSGSQIGHIIFVPLRGAT